MALHHGVDFAFWTGVQIPAALGLAHEHDQHKNLECLRSFGMARMR